MKTLYLIFGLISLLLVGCDPMAGQIPPPTPPSTMPELLDVLSTGGDEARIGAAVVIGSKGSEAAIAVPILIENLRIDGHSEVRETVAVALGRIGPEARPAVPMLISVMKDDYVHAQAAAAWALGKIGDLSAVPALVETVRDDRLVDSEVVIRAAEALETLTSQEFPGRQGGDGYLLDEDDTPLVVLAAREWWEKEGKYQDWPEPVPDNLP